MAVSDEIQDPLGPFEQSGIGQEQGYRVRWTEDWETQKALIKIRAPRYWGQPSRYLDFSDGVFYPVQETAKHDYPIVLSLGDDRIEYLPLLIEALSEIYELEKQRSPV